MSDDIIAISGQNLFINTYEDCNYILSEIKAKYGTHTIILGGNSYGIDAIDCIAKEISNMELFNVDFSDIFTARDQTQIIPCMSLLCNALKKDIVVSLNCSDNALGMNGMKIILNFINENSVIKKINICNIGLGSMGMKIFSSGLLCHDYHIEKINLARNRIGDNGCKNLAIIIKQLKYLKSLNIAQNDITFKGLEYLIEPFISSNCMEKLNIYDNRIGKKSIYNLMHCLDKMIYLKKINLGDCMLNCTEIIKKLKMKSNLEFIDLSYCELDDSVLYDIKELIKNNLNLNGLKLEGNCFTEGGIEIFMEFLRENNKIDICNDISEEVDI